MPAPPKLEQLDADLKAAIVALCADRQLSVDELFDRVRNLGVDVSRATVGRYRKDVRDVANLMQESRGMAAALKSEMGELDENDQSTLNYQMLQDTLFRVLMKQTRTGGDEDAQASIKELKQLAEMLHRMAQTRKLDADRVLKIRLADRTELKKKLDGIEADVRDSDTKPDAAAILKRVREEIYGIYDEPEK